MNDRVKKNIEKLSGMPYDEFIKLDEKEASEVLKQKNGENSRNSESEPKKYLLDCVRSSGDDSVLLNMGHVVTPDQIDNKITEILNNRKESGRGM